MPIFYIGIYRFFLSRSQCTIAPSRSTKMQITSPAGPRCWSPSKGFVWWGLWLLGNHDPPSPGGLGANVKKSRAAIGALGNAAAKPKCAATTETPADAGRSPDPDRPRREKPREKRGEDDSPARLFTSSTARSSRAHIPAGGHGRAEHQTLPGKQAHRSGMAGARLPDGGDPAQERCRGHGGEGMGRAGEGRGGVWVDRRIKAAELRKLGRRETGARHWRPEREKVKGTAEPRARGGYRWDFNCPPPLPFLRLHRSKGHLILRPPWTPPLLPRAQKEATPQTLTKDIGRACRA